MAHGPWRLATCPEIRSPTRFSPLLDPAAATSNLFAIHLFPGKALMDREVHMVTVMAHSSELVSLPHHRLDAFAVAVDFVRLIRNTPIADANMRKHAQGSAGACARNLAEGAGRRSRADKMRAYSMARGELCEAIAAVEIDEALGGCTAQHVMAVQRAGSRLDAMMRSLTHEAGT